MSGVENKYSYAKFIMAVGRNNSTAQAEKLLSEIYMDLFLKGIHREQIKERLITLIDQSLDNRDENGFLEYSRQLEKFEDAI